MYIVCNYNIYRIKNNNMTIFIIKNIIINRRMDFFFFFLQNDLPIPGSSLSALDTLATIHSSHKILCILFMYCIYSSVHSLGLQFTCQVWRGISASGTSSPGPWAAALWRWFGCGEVSSGALRCCVPSPTRCWCWGASRWAPAPLAGAGEVIVGAGGLLGRAAMGGTGEGC